MINMQSVQDLYSYVRSLSACHCLQQERHVNESIPAYLWSNKQSGIIMQVLMTELLRHLQQYMKVPVHADKQ